VAEDDDDESFVARDTIIKLEFDVERA